MANGKTEGETVNTEASRLGRGKLRQFFAYLRNIFSIKTVLAMVRDRRQQPTVPTEMVVCILFFVGVLRIRSFNALEPTLAEATMQRALGVSGGGNSQRVCSVDTLSYALARMDPETARKMVVHTLRKAERNKVFRHGGQGGLRFVAIDGWEPFSSRSRHCPACLTREIHVGTKERNQTVTEYYHAFVVAFYLDDRMDLVIDMEPIRSADVRIDSGEKDVKGHEGELTAAKRLLPRLRATHRWIDVLVLDALYANGPFLTLAKALKYGVVVILKKEANEPLKEAFRLWGDRGPDEVHEDRENKERIELWNNPGLETLRTYDGPIRVVRGTVHKEKNGTTNTWCFAVTGIANGLSNAGVLKVGRSRWHIENTAFYQWTQYWHFDHVFTHSENAVASLFWIFFLAFNLLQLFVYRNLGGYGRDQGKDVTRTLVRLIDEMRDDLARLTEPLDWDTS